MKHKLKKILLLYLLSGMLFVSCSLEEEYLKQDNANLKIKIERKTFHELMKEEKFNAAYTKISKQKNPISSSALGRTVMEAEYDFTISNIPAKVITYGNNISYSFHINRNVSNSNYFENLVVKVDSTTIPKAYIIKYVLNSNPIFISEHNAYTLDAQTEITQINYNDTEAKIEYYDGCAVVTLWCPYDGPHPAGPECLNQRFDDLYWVRDTSGCGDGLDSGGGGSSGPVDTTGGGGGTGGTGDLDTPHNDSGNNIPIVTAPVLEFEEEEDSQLKFKPCDELKSMLNKLIANSNPPKTVLTNLNDLKTNVTTNKERMYLLGPTPGTLGNSNHNIYAEIFAESNENEDIVIVDSQNIIIDIMMHTHWDTAKHLSIFSLEDIYEIYKKIASGQINLENKNYFTTLVITAHGTQYAIKFSNIQAFVAWGDDYFMGWDHINQDLRIAFQDAKEKKFYYDTGIKLGNTPEIKASNELAWASFIQTNNLGLELYRVNNSFSEFTKLSTTLFGDLKETPCTN